MFDKLKELFSSFSSNPMKILLFFSILILISTVVGLWVWMFAPAPLVLSKIFSRIEQDRQVKETIRLKHEQDAQRRRLQFEEEIKAMNRVFEEKLRDMDIDPYPPEKMRSEILKSHERIGDKEP